MTNSRFDVVLSKMSSRTFAAVKILVFLGVSVCFSESSSIPAAQILVSWSPTVTLYSCFMAKGDDINTWRMKEMCCRIVEQIRSANDSLEEIIDQKCLSEIAQVPPTISNMTSPSGNSDDTAKLVWTVSNPNSLNAEGGKTTNEFLKQHIVDPTGNAVRTSADLVDTLRTVTPYHKTTLEREDDTAFMVPLNLRSQLGRDGGMHRLFHHKFELPETSIENPRYFVFLTVPKGMFIDLDDPLETAGTIHTNPKPMTKEDATESLGEKTNSFLVETDTKLGDRIVSFNIHLHAASVCDIEQPSFVSGQHLLVWEIEDVVIRKTENPETSVLEFATKLHLRYPHPSTKMEDWIDLPTPLLFGRFNDHSKLSATESGMWNLALQDRVWVAAGNEEDHDWIMCMTIAFCCIGVGIMLRDISSVSLWDDV